MEKQERIEGLVLGRGGNVSLRDEVRQVRTDFGSSELSGVASSVAFNVADDSSYVGLFSVVTVSFCPACRADPAEEGRGVVGGTGHDWERSG